MSRFLLAWELGGGMGHLVPLAQLAQVLVEQGHEVHLALRELSGAAAALGAMARSPQVHLWQAPVWMPRLEGLPPPATYAELLFRAGFLDAARLAMLVRAWRSLLHSVAPALLVVDHAPTALLAARGLPMRRATFGTGFFQPPALQPLPVFRDWEAIEPARVARSEQHVLSVCNQVLAELGAPPLDALHELLAADERFLLTWPELDHYPAHTPGRAGARHWGALAAREQGAPARWSDGEGPLLFAYLHRTFGALDAVLEQLAQAPCRCLAWVPGLGAAQRQRYSRSGLVFAEAPVSMVSAMAQAQAVLCHAGSGTVHTALQAGLPVLMLPMHAEQLLFARRVAGAGAGAWLLESEAGPRLLPTLARVLHEDTLRNGARALASAHAPERYGDVARRVAARCAELAVRSGV